MDQEEYDKNKQSVLHFKCTKKKVQLSGQAMKVENILDSETTNFSLVTPERKILSSMTRNRGVLKHSTNDTKDIVNDAEGDQLTKMVQVPEKYMVIVDFFNRMVCSVRLLGLSKKLPTFTNISTQIKVMTNRKFLYYHLAQIKHLLPESILVEKVLTHDKETLCVGHDLKIVLCLDNVQCRVLEKPISMALQKAFCARLLEFHNANPESLDIPEALLPYPFNRKDKATLHKELSGESPMLSTESTQLDYCLSDCSWSTSHFSPSTKKRFCEKSPILESQTTLLLASPICSKPVLTDVEKTADISAITKPPMKNCSDLDYSIKSDCGKSSLQHDFTTPSKLTVDPVKTPALLTPRNVSIVSPEKDCETEKQLTSSARRLLMFSPTKSIKNTTDCAMTLEYAFKDEQMNQKEMKNQTVGGQKNLKRQQMLTALPDLFSTVRNIFRSINSYYMTKQELVHKILYYEYNIEETSEVEEMLQLLETLVPDWISTKTSSAGDFLYCIDKCSDPESIRARIIEAV